MSVLINKIALFFVFLLGAVFGRYLSLPVAEFSKVLFGIFYFAFIGLVSVFLAYKDKQNNPEIEF